MNHQEGAGVSAAEYSAGGFEFMNRHDSLCENVTSELCDCSKCPTNGLCTWLHENAPNFI